MDRCRAATPAPAFGSSSLRRLDKLTGGPGGDDSEIDVFAAERYFHGDDDALWCATRSSSSLSSAFRTGTHEHDLSVPTPTAATTSSEASWNSRSALLPVGKAVAAIAPEIGEKKPSGTASERTDGKKAPPSSHLGRWLLGLAGCACTGGEGDESSGSANDDEFCDEVEDADNVVGVGCKERATEEAAVVRVRPGRWLDDGDACLAGTAAYSPVQLPGDGHRRAASSSEFSWPVLNPAVTSTASDLQRRKSFRQVGGQGSTLDSAKQGSAFTIVVGNTARGGPLHAAVAGGGSPGACRMPCRSSRRSSGEDEAAALSELECAYPPSEASVVWSVTTAEGAASCNFSSAASGYYHYYFNDREDSASRHAARKSNWMRRRSGITSSGGLLMCMREKAVDAVGPAGSVARSVPTAGGRAGRCGNADSCRWRPER